MRQPAQSAGDHQVQHQKQLVFEREHDALAQPAHAGNALALGVGDRRQRGAQHEEADKADVLEALAGDARLEALGVDDDVGQFGHRGTQTTPNAPSTPAAARNHSGCTRVLSASNAVAPVTTNAVRLWSAVRAST